MKVRTKNMEEQKLDLEEKQEGLPEPAGPQPPEPVKSGSARLYETIDRAAEQKAARLKITESVRDKRKQAAAMRERGKQALPVHLKMPMDRHSDQIALCGALGSTSLPNLERADEHVVELFFNVTCPDCLKIITERQAEVRIESADIEAKLAEDEKVDVFKLADMSFDETLNFGLKQALELYDVVKKDTKARELREIEMHNTNMDAMLQITNGMGNITEALQTICNMIGDLNTILSQINQP